MYDFLLELKKVSIWGALPLFVNVIFVIIIITVSSMKKDKLSPVDELCDKRKNHKLQKIFLRRYRTRKYRSGGYCGKG